MLGLSGKKLGMTQKFAENGDLVPVTVIKCGPCTVTQKKTVKNDGYNALQVGFEEMDKPQRASRAMKGHFQKAKTPIFRHTSEYRMDDIDCVNVGDRLGVELFKVGDVLNIRGRSKGRGFQGVMKRHGKAGGCASHGSHFHRAPGSIGMCTSPGRVIKNTRLPGHMGAEFVTAKNRVVEVDPEEGLLFVKGAVPGATNGYLRIVNKAASLDSRLPKREEVKAAEEPPEEKKVESKPDEKPAEKREEV